MTSKTLKTLATILIAITLSGCANKPLETQRPSQGTTIDSVGKMKSIGAVLGCMFAPDNPECVKLRSSKSDDKPHQSQKEYLEEVNKEFEQLDEDAETKNQ